MNKKSKGLVLVFTGNGKGKTTAAVGCAVRMIKHGKRVGMVQFFKRAMCSGTRDTKTKGKTWTVDRGSWPGFRVWSFGGGFTWSTARDENAASVQKAWAKGLELLRDPKYDMVIFDEINIAFHYKFLKVSHALKALKRRCPSQHVVLTGRGAPRAIQRFADLVTEMKCVKHSYDRGIPAQQGLEF